jgi:hypothetical protein
MGRMARAGKGEVGRGASATVAVWLVDRRRHGVEQRQDPGLAGGLLTQ